MPGCCAVGCSNRTEKGFRLFLFPRNPERREIWVNEVKRENWIVTDTSRLCETHFEYTQFESTRVDGKRKLKPNAVPTIFLPKHVTTSRRPLRKKKEVNELLNCGCSTKSQGNDKQQDPCLEDKSIKKPKNIVKCSSWRWFSDEGKKMKEEIGILQAKIRKLEAEGKNMETFLGTFLSEDQISKTKSSGDPGTSEKPYDYLMKLEIEVLQA